MANKKVAMKWGNEKDELLIKEMFSSRPWEYPSGSSQRGAAWEEIATVLNLLDGFFVNQRSVRDRYNNLVSKYVQKRNSEEKASGISPEYSKLDYALEELHSLFSESEKMKDEKLDEKKRKVEEEKKKAMEIRQQSLETFSQTRKRKSEEGEVTPTRSKKNDVLSYLCEKNERENKLREKEVELKEKELDIRKQEADNITRQLKIRDNKDKSICSYNNNEVFG